MTQYQLLPGLQEDEYEALKADIAKRGVQVPVEYDELGNILDGHHRVQACEELGIKDWPKIVRVGMSEDAKREHVLALNIARRHLTRGERAQLEERLRGIGWSLRRIAEQIGVPKSTVADDLQVSETGHLAGTVTGADGKHYPARRPVALFNPEPLDVRRAQEWQELGAEASAPSIATPAEMRKLYRDAMAEPEKTPALPTGLYAVVYADPPWQYGDKLVDGYGPAEDHYPTMSTEELCALDVKSHVAENAVLFLWVTSPMLEECFQVIRAWGFEYKASFVWDKVAHNYGHYNSVRHELLLICTRGSCLPESKELVDSVQEIPRSEAHSAKPRQFREIIMKLYPTGPRIELFARDKPSDWDVWGAEA